MKVVIAYLLARRARLFALAALVLICLLGQTSYRRLTPAARFSRLAHLNGGEVDLWPTRPIPDLPFIVIDKIFSITLPTGVFEDNAADILALDDLRTLTLVGGEVNDDTIRVVRMLPKLGSLAIVAANVRIASTAIDEALPDVRELHLTNCIVPSTGLGFRNDFTARHASYASMDFSGTHFVDNALSSIADMDCRELLLSYTNIADDSAKIIVSVAGLHRVDVSHTAISSEGVREIAQSPMLRTIKAFGIDIDLATRLAVACDHPSLGINATDKPWTFLNAYRQVMAADGATEKALAPDAMNRLRNLAIEQTSKAIELFPESMPLYLNRGELFLADEKFDEAIADLSHAIKIAPSDATLWTSRGSAEFRRGRYVEAIDDESRAIELEPRALEPLVLRARAFSAIGKNQLAITDFNYVLQLSPDDDAALAGRAHAFERLGKWESAVADYSRLIEVHPSDPKYFELRASAYSAMGNAELAERDRSAAERLASELSKTSR